MIVGLLVLSLDDSSPKVSGEQLKTKQPIHHWTEYISIQLHLSLKGEHFTVQEKMAGTRSELVPTNHTPEWTLNLII